MLAGNTSKLVLAVMIASALAPAFAPSAAALNGSLDDSSLSWHSLTPGQVLARGFEDPDTGACIYPTTATSITFRPEEVVSFEAMDVTSVRREIRAVPAPDEACTLVVGSLIEEICSLGVPADCGPGSSGPVAPTGGSAGEAGILSHVCKEFESYIWTHSVFGESDWLTRRSSTMKYCYDGTYVSRESAGGYCQGNGLHYFTADACNAGPESPGPSSYPIYQQGTGEYHQVLGAPPYGQYYHSLSSEERAWPDGGAQCSFWWDGDMPPGPLWGCYWRS